MDSSVDNNVEPKEGAPKITGRWQALGVCVVFLLAMLVQSIALVFISPLVEQSLMSFVLFLCFHSLAVTLGVVFCWLRLPERYCYLKVKACAVVGLPIFFIPLFGLLGMSLAVMAAIRNPTEKDPEFAIAIEFPELPFKPVDIDLTRGVSGGLLNIIKHEVDPDKRANAVLSTQRMPDRHAVPILQVALKDPVDDVRLLAYSMLDQKENGINLKIKETLTELETSLPSIHAKLHKELASLFWELAYMELAQGDVLVHVLSKAREHIEYVLVGNNDAGACFLLGRILLKQGQLDLAEKSLKKACEFGFDELNITTYMAEIAFCRNDYHLIPAILAALPANERNRTPIKDTAEYWQAA